VLASGGHHRARTGEHGSETESTKTIMEKEKRFCSSPGGSRLPWHGWGKVRSSGASQDKASGACGIALERLHRRTSSGKRVAVLEGNREGLGL
jgi:hypothetical protein